MLAVLALAATLWAVASLLRVPVRVKLALLALIWVAVVVVNLSLPQGATLRLATGGDARPWLVLAGIVALVWAYRALLGGLRGRVQLREAAAAPAPSTAFTEAELNRYARHIMLRELGGPGQRRLKDARVLVVGAGGLGSPALLYLAAAGVGTLGVIDDDRVDSSNLQRQVIHTDDRIGEGKVFSAKTQIEALNPFVTVRPYMRRLTPEIVTDLIADYDLVLDGTDNFDTRYLVNRTCAALGKPLIAGAITQWEGQLSLYDPARGGACYECLFPQRPAPGLVPTCAEAGVVAALPGVIGTMMALEAIKHLTSAGEGLRGRLMIYDGLYGETRMLTTHPRPGCAACGHP
jgi:molybdopterin/thiamine biosynthesis adenylyltransferase